MVSAVRLRALEGRKRAMKCPNCSLWNPPTAQRCDCGYDFDKHRVDVAFAPPKIPMPAQVLGVFLTIVLVFVWGDSIEAVGAKKFPVPLALTVGIALCTWAVSCWRSALRRKKKAQSKGVVVEIDNRLLLLRLRLNQERGRFPQHARR